MTGSTIDAEGGAGPCRCPAHCCRRGSCGWAARHRRMPPAIPREPNVPRLQGYVHDRSVSMRSRGAPSKVSKSNEFMTAFSRTSAARWRDIQSGPPAPGTHRRTSPESAREPGRAHSPAKAKRQKRRSQQGSPAYLRITDTVRNRPSRLMWVENATLEVSASAAPAPRQ